MASGTPALGDRISGAAGGVRAVRATNHYMADYKSSRVLSLRIDADLLDAVRERARAEGRSVSGQIVYLVRERVETDPEPKPIRKISGWLSQRPVPDSFTDFQSGRARASAKLRSAVRRKARAK